MGGGGNHAGHSTSDIAMPLYPVGGVTGFGFLIPPYMKVNFRQHNCGLKIKPQYLYAVIILSIVYTGRQYKCVL